MICILFGPLAVRLGSPRRLVAFVNARAGGPRRDCYYFIFSTISISQCLLLGKA